MTTDKPTCPFCLREMTESWDERLPSTLPRYSCVCPVGVVLRFLTPAKLEALTAAVMEMRKRDHLRGGIDCLGTYCDHKVMEIMFASHIDRLKAEEAK